MKKQREIFITKGSGNAVPFERHKLELSLQKSKANKEDIDSILKHIENILYPGITTKEIYKNAFKLLYKKQRHTAEIYNLKSAIAELGPTGFPFEKYIGELLKFKGYEVKIGQNIKGMCVDHEVDIVAIKNDRTLLAECKFHTDPNRHSDVKVPMYIYSRFEDILEAWDNDINTDKELSEGIIYTNTRFTQDAVQYANCKGLKLIAWDYPQKGSLKNQIDLAALYPITCMTRLTKEDKTKLLQENLVLVKDLCGRKDLLRKIGITNQTRIANILKDAEKMCAK